MAKHMKTYQIHLIRHGLTEGNLKGQYIGSTDLPLCEQGIRELERLSAEFEYPGAGVFISSPMKRCTESMKILYPEARVLEIEELRECDFGEFEGQTAEQLKDSESFKEWMAADAEYAPYGGESGNHFSSRVFSVFEQIVDGLMKTQTTSSVIMTHGGIISMILSRYGLPQASPSEWGCDAGCGYSIRIHPQLWTSGQVFEVYSRLPLEKEPDDEDDDE